MLNTEVEFALAQERLIERVLANDTDIGAISSERQTSAVAIGEVDKILRLVSRNGHDTLDNRRSNLRICTQAENTRNARKRKNSQTKYKGVSKNKTGFQAVICYNKKIIQLGWFKNEELAARAYDVAAIEYFGPFCNLNFNNNHDFYII